MSGVVRMEDELTDKIAFLSNFKDDILAHFEGRGGNAVRSRINRGMARARSIVAEAGVLKTVTLSPPPAIGGLMVRNADPFNFILESYYGMSTAPSVADMIEEAIGVLEDPEYARRLSAAKREGERNQIQTKRPKGSTAVRLQKPELPEKVTLLWLVHNVPIRFWFWLLGLLAAAFAAGARWGPLITG